MDEKDLQAVFRAAADGGPDAGFGHADIVRASDRITARRRSMLTGAVAALVVVAGVGGVGGALALNRPSAATSSAAGAPAAGDDAAPQRAAPGDGSLQSEAAPGGAAASGGAGPLVAPASPPGAPLGPGTGPCANRQDPALRALLNAALPAAASAPEAATSDICLPGAQRYVSVELGGEVLTVAYLPPGTTASVAPGSISARTASGGTVIVPAAYPQLLADLAPHL